MFASMWRRVSVIQPSMCIKRKIMPSQQTEKYCRWVFLTQRDTVLFITCLLITDHLHAQCLHGASLCGTLMNMSHNHSSVCYELLQVDNNMPHSSLIGFHLWRLTFWLYWSNVIVCSTVLMKIIPGLSLRFFFLFLYNLGIQLIFIWNDHLGWININQSQVPDFLLCFLTENEPISHYK